MSCLITGGTGYIGKRLSDELGEIYNGDIYTSGSADFKLDDIDSIRRYFSGKNITKVINLAAEIMNKDTIFSANISGLYNLMLVCKEESVKYLLFSSSNNIYGLNGSHAFSEKDVPLPVVDNWYALSKYVGEIMIKDFCLANSIGYAIIRIADVYGPGQKYGNLLKTIVNCLKNGALLQLYGKGIRERDYIYITDVVKGLSYVCQQELQGIYNLGTGKGTNIKQLLKIANELSGYKCGITYKAVEHEDISKVVLNVDKLKEAGFTTQIDLRQGLQLILMEEDHHERT